MGVLFLLSHNKTHGQKMSHVKMKFSIITKKSRFKRLALFSANVYACNIYINKKCRNSFITHVTNYAEYTLSVRLT